MPPYQLEVLAGVERGGAFDPRMDGVGGDNVKLFAGGQEIVPRVVIDDLHARVVENIVVLFGEILRDGSDDQRFNLADHDSLNAGMVDKASCGDACAQSDDQNRPWARMKQSGQVAEHPLQPHVSPRGRRFILAADVKVPYADRRFRNSNGCVHSLARVQDIWTEVVLSNGIVIG